MATYQVDPRSYDIDWENTLRKASFLRSAFSEIQDVSPLLVNVTKVCPLDLRDAKNNEEIEKLLICKHHLGGYSELRQIYNTEAYAGKDPRVVHLGVDYTSHAGHPVHAPLDGSIHSFQDNAIPGDYGPTIILEHEIDGVNFYTLYGHLSRDSLKFLEVGQQISRGEPIAKLGKMEENGGWFPHLHFQVMTDIMSFRGDFPAVVPTRTLEEWKEILLNPMPLVFVYGRSGVTPASFSQKDEL